MSEQEVLVYHVDEKFQLPRSRQVQGCSVQLSSMSSGPWQLQASCCGLAPAPGLCARCSAAPATTFGFGPSNKSPLFLGRFSPKSRPFYAIIRPFSPSWRQEAQSRERTVKRREKWVIPCQS